MTSSFETVRVGGPGTQVTSAGAGNDYYVVTGDINIAAHAFGTVTITFDPVQFFQQPIPSYGLRSATMALSGTVSAVVRSWTVDGDGFYVGAVLFAFNSSDYAMVINWIVQDFGQETT